MTQAQLIAFDKLWNFNDPAATEQKFRELLPAARTSGDKDYLLQLQTQIARTQGLQRKFEEAHQTLDDVAKSLDSTTASAEIRYHLERGRVFNSSKKADVAMPLFIKAFELSVSFQQDTWAVDAAHMVAIADPNPEKQMEWNLKAVAIAEKSEDPTARGWLGSLYNNIGWTYHSTGRFDEALDIFKKALAFREAQGAPANIRIAKWCIARTYRSLKNYDAACEIQFALEKEFAEDGGQDGYVFEEIAELYHVTGRGALAKKYFGLAFNELSKDAWLKANEGPRLVRLKELSL